MEKRVGYRGTNVQIKDGKIVGDIEVPDGTYTVTVRLAKPPKTKWRLEATGVPAIRAKKDPEGVFQGTHIRFTSRYRLRENPIGTFRDLAFITAWDRRDKERFESFLRDYNVALQTGMDMAKLPGLAEVFGLGIMADVFETFIPGTASPPTPAVTNGLPKTAGTMTDD